MTSSLLVASLLVVAGFAAPARADDAADAMKALGQAGVIPGGAPGGAPGAGTPGGKKKDEDGFARPLTAPVIQKTGDGDRDGKPAKKKAAAKSKPSKYKSTELPDYAEHSYRFNENGEPLDAPKKKPAAKAKKKTSDESADKGESDGKSEACSSDAACAEKKSDGDAF